MSELEKLQAGLEYDFSDPEVAARKARAAQLCQEFNAIPATDPTAQKKKIREILGSTGPNLSVQSRFNCDYGLNIHVVTTF